MIDNALRAAAADLARRMRKHIPSAKVRPSRTAQGAPALLVTAAPGSDLTRVPKDHLGYPVRARYLLPHKGG